MSKYFHIFLLLNVLFSFLFLYGVHGVQSICANIKCLHVNAYLCVYVVNL